MKAKVFNEENLIREKMRTMSKHHDSKVTEMSNKLRTLQNEISKMRKTETNPAKRKANSTNLFHDKNKKMVKTSRTASPLSRSRSRSRSPVARSKSRSRSPVARSKSRSRSRSPSSVTRGDSRVESPAVPTAADNVVEEKEAGDTGQNGKEAEKSPEPNNPQSGKSSPR